MLKGYKERVAGVAGLELQAFTLKKHVSWLNDKLVSFDASFSKSKAKGKERKKKIKSLTKSLDNLHAEVAHLSASLNQATMLEAEKDEEIHSFKSTPSEVQGEFFSLAASAGFEHGFSMHHTKLKPENLARPANVPTLRDACIYSLMTKESTVTTASKSLGLSTNADLTPYIVSSEHNEEMDIFVALEDVVDLVVVGSGCASSGPNDVAISLSAGEKVDGLVPSSTAGERRVVCQRILVSLSLGQTDCRCMVVHLADPESCHTP
nr:hypothetical protein [Tanacetum cinerariifolium]